MSCGSTSWPKSQAWPSLAGKQPVSIFIVVDLAAAVGAEEAEDLTATDAEAHVVHCREVTETHGQVPRLDCDLDHPRQW